MRRWKRGFIIGMAAFGAVMLTGCEETAEIITGTELKSALAGYAEADAKEQDQLKKRLKVSDAGEIRDTILEVLSDNLGDDPDSYLLRLRNEDVDVLCSLYQEVTEESDLTIEKLKSHVDAMEELSNEIKTAGLEYAEDKEAFSFDRFQESISDRYFFVYQVLSEDTDVQEYEELYDEYSYKSIYKRLPENTNEYVVIGAQWTELLPDTEVGILLTGQTFSGRGLHKFQCMEFSNLSVFDMKCFL